MQPPDLPRSPGLPLIGRALELEAIDTLIRDALAGRGGTLLLSGGSGVGKSRLLEMVGQEAASTGWTVARGRAYPVESGIPYAPFADAFVPLLRNYGADALATLTRGAEAELAHIFPSLGALDAAAGRSADAAEIRARILWNFAQLLSRFGSRSPLLVLLDDLHWADASSLELLHYSARQISGDRVAFLCAYNDEFLADNPKLRSIETSLTAIGAARSHIVGPLTHSDTATLIQQAFGLGESAARELAALLFGWTRGNPFFLEEALKTLVDSGRLRQTEDGGWEGWDLNTIELPRTVRDAVLNRISGLGDTARQLADTMAVIGTNVSHEALRAVAAFQEDSLVEAVDELRKHHLITERLEGESVVYDFTHPIVRDVLYTGLGLARTRQSHAKLAESLEAFFGPEAVHHADELAYHYSRTSAGEHTEKAVRYLSAAGREALRKFSNREAADYLTAALERATGGGGDPEDLQLIEDLARARLRLGDFEGAVALFDRRLALAEAANDQTAIARVRRRMGLIDYWSGNYREALEQFELGMEAAGVARDDMFQARLHLARGECLMELGQPDEARREIEAALEIAERCGRGDLLARVHLVLLLLHTWTGPPARARSHGEQALAFATQLGDRGLQCTVHWALAVFSGLTGDAAAITHHNAEGERLAQELSSPLHRLRVAEPAIEFMSNTGAWSEALDLGERTIATARALNQRSFLARLLVWTALIHLGRGDLARGRRYVDEAWELSGAGRTDRPTDVHTVVPAHVGLTAFHVASGDFDAAVRTAEAGLEIADRTGYTVWAIHRLLPLLAEALVSKGDLEGAARVGARLRADSERVGHTLGAAWADSVDAVIVWLRGDIEGGIERLGAAADRLEAIPAIPDAARLRRHFAARLRDHGDREAALRELRRIHEIFSRLGAERELAKTREQIRELGARPPAREPGQGIEGLSSREMEIALLVAEGKSNKTIGKVLDISARTVSTHLSNIFGKVGVASRGALAEFIRRRRRSDR